MPARACRWHLCSSAPTHMPPSLESFNFVPLLRDLICMCLACYTFRWSMRVPLVQSVLPAPGSRFTGD
eukprot:6455766-Pyramimonas_sp.AAC.1